ncbi:MAG: N-acetylneuraminate synthase family protein [Clostridiales bacterium]|nr:N-acetylneuraminate synthase family protein [Clostridiales bacterium]
MKYKAPYLIAEVGCNHKGNMEIAYEFIKTAAAFCGVDAVKFQKRNNRELLTHEEYNTPHPNPHHSYGDTYGEHREFLELDLEQHAQLKAWCEEYGLTYGTSVWDLTSAQEITGLNPKFIKIPSACNNHYAMIHWLCEHYRGDIHISLGMTSREEEKKLMEFFVQHNRNKDLVVYACTSGYPVEFEDICLMEISRLVQMYGDTVKQIGFSGHHNGIAVDIAAYALGANVIERHFTLDRTWKGTDHAASLEPDGLRRLKRDLANTQKALAYKREEILPVEQVQRAKLKYKVRDTE